MSWKQLTTQLPRELPKQALHPISADGSPESFSHDNPDPAATHICPANQHIKQGGRDTTAVLFGILDVATAFQEQIPVTSTLRHRHHHERGPARTGLPLRDQIYGLGMTTHRHPVLGTTLSGAHNGGQRFLRAALVSVARPILLSGPAPSRDDEPRPSGHFSYSFAYGIHVHVFS